MVTLISAARAVLCTSRSPCAHLGRTPLRWCVHNVAIKICRNEYHHWRHQKYLRWELNCVYPNMHWAGGVCIPTCTGQGGCMPRGGCVCPWGMSAQGVSVQGVWQTHTQHQRQTPVCKLRLRAVMTGLLFQSSAYWTVPWFSEWGSLN